MFSTSVLTLLASPRSRTARPNQIPFPPTKPPIPPPTSLPYASNPARNPAGRRRQPLPTPRMPNAKAGYPTTQVTIGDGHHPLGLRRLTPSPPSPPSTPPMVYASHPPTTPITSPLPTRLPPLTYPTPETLKLTTTATYPGWPRNGLVVGTQAAISANSLAVWQDQTLCCRTATASKFAGLGAHSDADTLKAKCSVSAAIGTSGTGF